MATTSTEAAAREAELAVLAKKLLRAADLIAEATEGLSDEVTQCASCGHEHYTDLVESDARKQLVSARKKARFWALTLRSPEARARHLADRIARDAAERGLPRQEEEEE